jgi:hypothetical protein
MFMSDYTYVRSLDIEISDKETEMIIEFVKDFNIELDSENIILSPLSFSKFKQSRLVKKTIKNLKAGDKLIVDSLEALGHSTISILRNIDAIKNIGATLILQKEYFELKPNDSIFAILNSLFSLENTKNSNQKATARKTLKDKKKNVGRKKGSLKKSMYYKYREKILKYDELGIPRAKIISLISEKSKHPIGTPQSLGIYIKKLKIEQEEMKVLAKSKDATIKAFEPAVLLLDSKSKQTLIIDPKDATEKT